MRAPSLLVAVATTVLPALAAYQGFNYGSVLPGGGSGVSDFEAAFKTAQGLAGTNGAFSSARLYTTIQASTANSPVSAIQAAINTKTSLLLGIWASAGQATVNNELTALKSAIAAHGDQLAPLVAGISVGSEDLYRITPTGISNGENPGAGPDVLTNYIKQVRDAVAGTALQHVPIGHVDTWTAWVNDSNKAVVDACDWIGVDAYPYFESSESNTISSSKGLFARAVDQTRAHVGDKPIWITETGWPVSGKTSGQAVPSTENAKTYWQQVGCPMFGSVNVWWYTMEDASASSTPNPSFGLTGSTLTTSPLYDLSCKNIEAGAAPSGVSGGSSPSGSSQPTPTGSKPGNGGAQTSARMGSVGAAFAAVVVAALAL